VETPKPKNKGGRPVGSMNKLAAQAIEQAKLQGLLPHELLLQVARGEPMHRVVVKRGLVIEEPEPYDFQTRVDAMKAAAPYYAPKISTVEVISGVPDDELDAIIARAAAEAGFDLGAHGEGEEGEDQSESPRRHRED
jgi:hypothetical protein